MCGFDGGSIFEHCRRRELILNEDYMMNIFKPIRDTVTPRDEYLTMMFEEKRGNVLSSRLEEEKVLPYDILRAELLYPTRVDVRKTVDVACQLGEIAAERFVTELWDKGKATCKYLTPLGGRKCQKNVSERERKDMLGLDAGNSVSESLHACTKSMQKECGPNARIDRLADVAQSQFNNDYG